MLHLEMQKGANAPKQAFETPPDELPHHCAVTLRAVANWLGSGRVVVGDAAFGSFLTCYELLKRGMYFIGIIKGCTKAYPVEYVKLQSTLPKGEYKVITTQVLDQENAERTIMAVLLSLKPGLIRNIISSYSSSLLGKEKIVYQTRRRLNEDEGVWYNERGKKTVRRPTVVDEGMQYFGAVDYNDRFRQGYLNWENSWPTKRLWVRVFTTVLGIICTNAFFAYEMEMSRVPTNAEDEKMKFFEFLAKLAYQLINNTYDEERDIRAALRPRTETERKVSDMQFPQLRLLKDLDIIRRGYDLTTEEGKRRLATYQRSCHVCKYVDKRGKSIAMKTSYFCSACYIKDDTKIICFCSPNNKRNCWLEHLAACHSIDKEEIL
jgi:hypothetical protein